MRTSIDSFVSDQEGRARFGLTFCPNVPLVTLVRRFVHSFYDDLVTVPDVSSRVALATHELLENALKYTATGETSVRIELNRPERSIVVQTWNRASPENIDTLQRVVNTIDAAPDPTAHYHNLLRQAVQREAGSGLGLARIRVEAEMTLTYKIIDHGVSVLAHASPAAGELS